MVDPVEIKFDVDTQGKECVFVKFRANDGAFSEHNNPLLSYKLGGSTKTFKNPTRGTLQLNTERFNKGDIELKKDDVIAWWIGPCKHAIIMGIHCAGCGESLEKTGFVEEKQCGRAQYVSSVHNAPGLVVALDHAKQLSDNNQKQLLNNKKLILLIDLDQTLIHTTNKAPRPNEVKQDIHGFKLYNVFYYTKIRPHAYKFLENLSRLFELHVVTYGQRVYAEQIVRLLDPDKRYFASRVLSRDELISANSKSVNLQALFPSGSQLVMMVDDRPDVWENSEALIWAKPYKFFTEIGDINAVEVGNEQETSSPTNTTEDEQEATSDKPTEEDDVLIDIERILIDVHRSFFEQYEEGKEVKPVADFAADLRKQVLKDEVIAFSGIVRQGADMKAHPLYTCCVRFGAQVVEEITDQTTTLIAVKALTEKYHAAKKQGIAIVTPKWIEECMACWRKIDKEKFALHVITEYEQTVKSEISHTAIFAKNDLKSMQDEVDAELAELSASSSDDDIDEDLQPVHKKRKE